MAVSYADCLSPYEHKGKVGMPELYDPDDVVEAKAAQLAEWIRQAKHTLIITGAGISTSAGIADFRGPTGVWTLEKQGKPADSIDFGTARPTYTHEAIRILEKHGYVSFLVSQNVDGLHHRSSFPLNRMAELHGNVFAEQCIKCKRRYYRDAPVNSFCLRPTGNFCEGTPRGRPCRGALHDMTLDWEHDLPEPDFSATKHEKKVDLTIHAGVDYVMRRVMSLLGLDCAKKEEGDADGNLGAKQEVVWESARPLEDPAALLKERTRKRKATVAADANIVRPFSKKAREATVSQIESKRAVEQITAEKPGTSSEEATVETKNFQEEESNVQRSGAEPRNNEGNSEEKQSNSSDQETTVTQPDGNGKIENHLVQRSLTEATVHPEAAVTPSESIKNSRTGLPIL
ncbi:unnamed protein product, partial [Mesorhabditis spiculigera]